MAGRPARRGAGVQAVPGRAEGPAGPAALQALQVARSVHVLRRVVALHRNVAPKFSLVSRRNLGGLVSFFFFAVAT